MQAVHETPHGDLTGHCTDGSPCPCQPSAEAVKDPDLSPYGVVIPKPPETEALDAAIENASKPLPGATALRLYLEQQTREGNQ